MRRKIEIVSKIVFSFLVLFVSVCGGKSALAAPTDEPQWSSPANGSEIQEEAQLFFYSPSSREGNGLHMLVEMSDTTGRSITYTTDDQMRIPGNPSRANFKVEGMPYPVEGVQGTVLVSFRTPIVPTGKDYSFRIGVYDPADNQTSWGREIRTFRISAVLVKPNPPVITILSESSIRIDMQPFQNVTYTVMDRGNQIASGKEAFVILNGLAANSRHAISYTVSNQIGSSPISDVAERYTFAITPKQPVVQSVSDKAIVLRLDSDNPSATLRRLQRSTNQTTWTTLAEQVDLRSYKDENVQPNSLYYYRTIDLNGNGIPSNPSLQAEARTIVSSLAAPKVTVLSSNMVRVGIPQVNSSTRNNIFINEKEVYAGPATVYEASIFSPNQEVRVAYTITNGSGTSALSTEARVYTWANKPINLQAIVRGVSAVVTWEQGQNPTKTEYLLNVNGNDHGSWVTDTTVTLTNLQVGQNRIKVKARNKDRIETGYTYEVAIVVQEAGNGTAPSNITPAYDTISKNLTVRFTPVLGISKYIVSALQNGKTVATRTTSADSVVFQEFSGGELLELVVTAKGGGEASTFFTVPYVDSPLGNIRAEQVSENGFLLLFENPDGQQVKLELWEGSDKLSTKSTRRSSYQFNRLHEGVTYTVRAYYSKTSMEQTVLRVTTTAVPEKPQMMPVKNLHVVRKTGKEITIGWDEPKNATKTTYYVVKRKEKGEDEYDFIKQTTSFTYVDKKVKKDKVYIYEVVAGDDNNLESVPMSMEETIGSESDLPEQKPVHDLEVELVNRRMTLRWEGKSESYKVERYSEDGVLYVSKTSKRKSIAEKMPEDGIWRYTVIGSSKGYKDTEKIEIVVKIRKGELTVLD